MRILDTGNFSAAIGSIPQNGAGRICQPEADETARLLYREPVEDADENKCICTVLLKKRFERTDRILELGLFRSKNIGSKSMELDRFVDRPV